MQYSLPSPHFSSLPWLSKGAVPQHLWLIQICPDVIPISGFLLPFPHNEAAPSVAICSGILTNCRLFALFAGLFFIPFGFLSSATKGQRSWAGRAGILGGGWAGPQCCSQTCCWESLISREGLPCRECLKQFLPLILIPALLSKSSAGPQVLLRHSQNSCLKPLI